MLELNLGELRCRDYRVILFEQLATLHFVVVGAVVGLGVSVGRTEVAATSAGVAGSDAGFFVANEAPFGQLLLLGRCRVGLGPHRRETRPTRG